MKHLWLQRWLPVVIQGFILLVIGLYLRWRGNEPQQADKDGP